jgi:predicted Zn-dependent peptidase
VEEIRRSVLDSGLRVVTEALPELRSVTIGAWVGTGSRDETDAQSGASHFLEHLLFKGTPERSAREIAEAVESVGGEMNAFTGQEETVFYVRVPDAHLGLAVDILSDVLWRPAFRPDEVDSERQVILEEIGMRDDTPDDLVHDLFAGALFPGHPLGRSVLGTDSSIEAMPRDDIAAYHAAHYRPGNIVIAAAGNLTHDDLVSRLAPRVSALDGSRPGREADGFAAPKSVAVIERPTEQAHVVVGMRAVSHLDPDRYALTVLNQALGGGMSSRLFQEVREERGLAYSVFSYRGAFADTGMLAIYAGTSPERVHETLAVIDAELDRLVTEHGLPARELDAAKGHLKGSIAMSLETSSSRMRRLGRAELIEGEIPSLDEIVARIDAVSGDDVERVVERVIADRPRTLATVGPFSDADFERSPSSGNGDR